MTVRVIYRGEADGAPVVSQDHGYGLVSCDTPKTPIVRAQAEVGERTPVIFEGAGLPNNAFAGFGRAESNLVDSRGDWVNVNREALLNLR